MRKYLLLGILCLVAFVLSFAAGYRVGSTRPVEIVRDTVEVIRIDTVVVEKPVPVYVRIVDTMRVPVRDTIRVRDSVFVELPREQAFYQDTAYRAWVSGYRPALDSIEVFQKTKVITITETVTQPPRRWGLGITAGYGATIGHDRSVGLAPFVGVGISYNFVSW